MKSLHIPIAQGSLCTRLGDEVHHVWQALNQGPSAIEQASHIVKVPTTKEIYEAPIASLADKPLQGRLDSLMANCLTHLKALTARYRGRVPIICQKPYALPEQALPFLYDLLNIHWQQHGAVPPTITRSITETLQAVHQVQKRRGQVIFGAIDSYQKSFDHIHRYEDHFIFGEGGAFIFVTPHSPEDPRPAIIASEQAGSLCECMNLLRRDFSHKVLKKIRTILVPMSQSPNVTHEFVTAYQQHWLQGKLPEPKVIDTYQQLGHTGAAAHPILLLAASQLCHHLDEDSLVMVMLPTEQDEFIIMIVGRL